MKCYFNDMPIGKRLNHMDRFPFHDVIDHLTWAAMKGELTPKQIGWYCERQPHSVGDAYTVLQNLENYAKGYTDVEESLLGAGRRFAEHPSEARALRRDQLVSISTVMYRKEWVECVDPNKTAWRAYIESLVRALDPAGLTKVGRTRAGLWARLGTVWTEEAALKVLELNECLGGPPLHSPGPWLPRGPGSILFEPIASDVHRYTDRQLESYACPEEPKGAHCPLCLVREWAALEPDRLARIALSVDRRLTRREQAYEDDALFVWEEDEDDCYREDD